MSKSARYLNILISKRKYRQSCKGFLDFFPIFDRSKCADSPSGSADLHASTSISSVSRACYQCSNRYCNRHSTAATTTAATAAITTTTTTTSAFQSGMFNSYPHIFTISCVSAKMLQFKSKSWLGYHNLCPT